MNTSESGAKPAGRLNRVECLRRTFIVGVALWVLVRTALVTLASWHSRIMRAEFGMASGLVLLWIVLGGGLMYLFRERIKSCLKPMAANWRLSFFLLATAMAMSEEVITTLMTNCARFSESNWAKHYSLGQLLRCHWVPQRRHVLAAVRHLGVVIFAVRLFAV